MSLVQTCIIQLIAIIIMCASCKHDPEPGLGGNAAIQGTVLIPDTLTTANRPVKGAVVFISYTDNNPASFNSSDTTDATGVYEFSNLQEGKTYYLRCVYQIQTQSGLVQYKKEETVLINPYKKGESRVISKDIILTLDPDVGSSIIYGRVFLNNVLTGLILAQPNVNVNLMLNNSRATPYAKPIKSDADGYYRFSGLPASAYYLTYDYTLTSEGQTLIYKATSTTASSATITNPVNVTLTLDSNVDLLVNVKGSGGGALSNFPVCLFSDSTVYAQNQNKDCKGSFFSGRTNSNGRVLIRNLTGGAKYFIYSADSLGKAFIKYKQSVKLSNIGITTETISPN